MYVKNSIKNAEQNEKRIKEVASESKSLLDDLIKKISEKEEENKKQNEEKESLEKKLNYIFDEVKRLNNEVERLNNEVKKSNNEVERLNNEQTLMEKEFQKIKNDKLFLNLRRNLEYFLFHFFNEPNNFRIFGITSSLKLFFNFVKNNFWLNSKRIITNESSINLSLKNKCFIEAEYQVQNQKRIEYFTENFYIDELKIKRLLKDLLDEFYSFDIFANQIENCLNQYQYLYRDIHSIELTPFSDFESLDTNQKINFQLILKITKFCENEN